MTEFESKVKEMRSLQKQYFATRNTDVLAECKRVEKEVDDMLGAKEHKSPTQIDIFGFDGDDKLRRGIENMSNFESITPSLKLCRLIPSDEFDYSELWWLVETIPGNKYFRNEYVCERGTCKESYGGDFVHYPAPMAQEILESLIYRGHLVDVASSWCSGYTVECHDGKKTISETDVNLAEAAMRLWLKLNK